MDIATARTLVGAPVLYRSRICPSTGQRTPERGVIKRVHGQFVYVRWEGNRHDLPSYAADLEFDAVNATTVRFADGSERSLAFGLAEQVRGIDADGDLLVPLIDSTHPTPAPYGEGEWLVALTPCCNASGKGWETGLVCRGCYRTVSEKYGDHSPLAHARVEG